MKKQIKVLLPLIINVILSSFFIILDKINYDSILKPKFTPPGYIFIIVWSIIYLIFYLTMLKFEKLKNIYFLYIIVLTFQTLWNFTFFLLGSYLLSILILLIMYFISFIFVYQISKENKKISYLYIIYLLWLIVAFYLNLGIFLLN